MSDEVALPAVSEDDIAASQDRVRALLLSRLERLYQPVEAAVAQAEAGGRPVDPRLLEIGRAIVRDVAGYYRLHRPPMVREEEEDPEQAAIDRRQLVSRRLEELEAKLQQTAGEVGERR